MPARKKVDTTKFTLDAFEAMCIEALGEKPGVTLELKDGTELHIPHPATVDDDRLTDIERIQGLRDLDEETYTDEDGKTQTRRIEKIGGVDAEPFQIRLARAILGPAEHKRFLEAGGKSALVLQAWKYLTDNDEGEGLEDPKPEM
ncbi:MAG: hypothetical protein J2P17_05715 [Mycobacterium sp.]|nr:hypothetical protein [Mycobacterium sp.]